MVLVSANGKETAAVARAVATNTKREADTGNSKRRKLRITSFVNIRASKSVTKTPRARMIQTKHSPGYDDIYSMFDDMIKQHQATGNKNIKQ